MGVTNKKINGKQYSKCFASFVEAKNWRADSELVMNTDCKKINFQDLAKKFIQYKEGRVSQGTINTYNNCLVHLKYFNRLSIAQIRPHTIDSWLEYIKKDEYMATQHKTRITYYKELKVLRQILVYYAEYLDDDYKVPIKKRHIEDCIINMRAYKEKKGLNQKRYLTQSEIKQFLGYLRNNKQVEGSSLNGRAYQYYVLALLQLSCGLRIGEACALSWDDINFDSSTISIYKNIQWSRKKGQKTFIQQFTKNGKTRDVFLINQVAKVLSDFRKECNHKHGLIFGRNSFTPISYRSIQYRYDAAFKALGIKWSSTHILRHSFATDFLTRTKDQVALSKILGHSSLRQTEHYAKITNQATKEGFDMYAKSIEESSNVLNFADQLGIAGNT